MTRRTPPRPPRRPGRPPADEAVLDQQRILTAADQLLTDGGWSAFSMRRLAQQLGVDPMAVYRYVWSKEQLGALVIAHRLARLTSGAGAKQSTSHVAISRRITRLARAYLSLIADAPTLAAALIADPVAAGPAAEQWLSLVARALGDTPNRRAKTRAQLLAYTLADFVHGYALAPGPRADAAFGRSVALIVAGALATR